MKDIIVYAMLFVSMVSCGSEHCYRCVEKTTVKDVIAPSTYGDTVERCGYTSKEIKTFENDSKVEDDRVVTEMECSEK